MPYPFNKSSVFDYLKEKHGDHASTTPISRVVVHVDAGGMGWEMVVAYTSIPLCVIIMVLVLLWVNRGRLDLVWPWCQTMMDRVRGFFNRHRARDDTGYEMADAPPLPAPRLGHQNRTDSERLRVYARSHETCV